MSTTPSLLPSVLPPNASAFERNMESAGWRLRDDGPSAASIMAGELRRRAQIGGLVLIAGFVLVFVGFAVH